MKATLIVEGKEFPIEIYDPELQKLLKPQKKTGYENVGEGHTYSYVNTYGEIKTLDHQDFDDDKRYDDCNYYSDYYVAENNARADKLMRKLRRFAVEHREKEIDWGLSTDRKYSISYDYHTKEFSCFNFESRRAHGCIHFDSMKAADLAIETFKDELVWYFTEYKDSL